MYPIVCAMDSLQDILSHYGTPEQPELTAIKQYVDEHFHTPISAAVNGNVIVVTVPSASLANTLRLQITTIQKFCKTDKRITFRIG
jgi:hypothetical protein